MGTWKAYAKFRKEMLDLIASERAAGRVKYLGDIRREMAAGRRTHYTKSRRQIRYNVA